MDPSGKRVAVIANGSTFTKTIMFLLDASTGEQASQRRYLDRENRQTLQTSYNLLLNDDGKLIYGENIIGSDRPNSYE